MVDIPYSFIEDGQTHPPYPIYQCPTLILHGLNDDVVPVETTLAGALERNERVKDLTTVILVEDDHGLTKEGTLKTLTSSMMDFLELQSKKKDGETGE